jgi:Tfp pilus assembly protein PilV
MTTSTPRTRKKSAAGFTLTEVIIASTLMVTIMAGVLSTGLFVMKSGYTASSYSEMEAQARQGLEIFGRDVRMAKSITWTSSTKIALTTTNKAGTDFVYVYEYANNAFTRTQTAPVALPAQTLITGIAANSFSMTGFKITIDPSTGNPYQVDTSDPSQASVDTKQLQLSLSVSRKASTGPSANANVISARYILRNKRVTT